MTWTGGTLPALPTTAVDKACGVNVHSTYSSKGPGDVSAPYSIWPNSPTSSPPSFQHIVDALSYTGIRHVRDNMQRSGLNPRQVPFWKAAGVDVCLLAGDPLGPPIPTMMAGLVQALPFLAAIEGPNEGDYGSTWVAPDRARQTAMHAAVRADHRFDHVPILAPSLAHPASFPVLGNMTAVSDAGNVHDYSGGKPQDAAVAYNVGLARRWTNPTGQPIWATEWGVNYNTANKVGNYGVPEDVAAAIIANGIFAQLKGGVVACYLYELLNEYNDYGLFRTALSPTPRPAATAIRNLLAYIHADLGGSAGPVQASVSAPGGMASQAFVGASGATYVVCWQTANPYNPTTGVTSWPSPKLVTVNAPKASWSTFEPLTGAAASLVGAGPHTVSVGNGPVIVKAA